MAGFRGDWIIADSDAMEIKVDDRERNGGVLPYLQAMDDVTVTIRRLKLGDYCVDQRAVFERKTMKDFAISLIDGRLLGQATRLATGTPRPIMILEGTAADLAGYGVRREALQGALITISVILNIPLLRSLDAQETASLIGYTGRQLQRIAHGVVARPGYRPRTKKHRQLYILQGFPGIGPKRARLLLDLFGSIEAIVGADEASLAAVEGIGAGTARTIRDMVKEGRLEYG